MIFSTVSQFINHIIAYNNKYYFVFRKDNSNES